MHEPTFLVLTALAAQPLHGYGLIQAVAQLSDGDVRLRAGTLYGALDRLTEQGLIEIDHEEAVDGRLRRYYRLSDSGAAALAVQAERLQRRATVAQSQLRRRAVPGMSFGARALGWLPTGLARRTALEVSA
ncbi:PadR family transcriptional regulator [Micromonospora sp. ATCC 39149]|uniref:Helix-turn-helix transcriptional regulator n=1 Tax=Micromonospora carbonacea TaxID=47853 RepID=A0A7D5YJ80_9ACTN|nr:PadR family transcriptional regulator [Micromonospora sp. ATCC 39149]QLJ99114.1 helix-turn-helix transcriptional regulator [Micromonospora carbonacea]